MEVPELSHLLNILPRQLILLEALNTPLLQTLCIKKLTTLPLALPPMFHFKLGKYSTCTKGVGSLRNMQSRVYLQVRHMRPTLSQDTAMESSVLPFHSA